MNIENSNLIDPLRIRISNGNSDWSVTVEHRSEVFYDRSPADFTWDVSGSRSYVRKKGHEHPLVDNGNVSRSQPVPLRIHSECATSGGLYSIRSDCGERFWDSINANLVASEL